MIMTILMVTNDVCYCHIYNVWLPSYCVGVCGTETVTLNMTNDWLHCWVESKTSYAITIFVHGYINTVARVIMLVCQ